MARAWIAVIDFGSQYTQLIARRVREQHVYCEILPCRGDFDAVLARGPAGFILSGGPASVYREGAPQLDPRILRAGKPILGICYGLQALCRALGADVSPAAQREFGKATLTRTGTSPLLEGLPRAFQVWMSHGDRVESLPAGFASIGTSDNSPYAAVADEANARYGVQFHPEVVHTPNGGAILANFLFRVCGLSPDWRMGSFVEEEVERIRRETGQAAVILGLSGGVDSATLAALLAKAVGRRLHCIFVDNGLLRAGEREEVERAFRGNGFDLNLHVVDASETFLAGLKGVVDPERKRKIIGSLFIDVFREKALSIPGAAYLAQGTLYPDVIESVSPWGGPSATIKSHHNVGGLPERIGFALLEPFRFLFKDEVREIARLLNLPVTLIERHPFPGPGLAVRIMGDVTPERLALLRRADRIVTEEIRAAGLYAGLWQAFAVLLPGTLSVGVMGDERTYECAAAVRAVHSTDGMTADWAHLPYDLLGRIANRIINEVRGINRVVYDISSKPPATIEWE